MLDYKVTVLKDAVASFDQKAHDFALRQMKDVLGVEIR
jgi:nicotinamidase-related amidase